MWGWGGGVRDGFCKVLRPRSIRTRHRTARVSSVLWAPDETRGGHKPDGASGATSPNQQRHQLLIPGETTELSTIISPPIPKASQGLTLIGLGPLGPHPLKPTTPLQSGGPAPRLVAWAAEDFYPPAVAVSALGARYSACSLFPHSPTHSVLILAPPPKAAVRPGARAHWCIS